MTTLHFSFLMICYNQERYIADALNSALAQDYPEPFEVVVSDDNSPDRTFEIASEIAASYMGPHKIVLNKNSRNLGIGGNFYKAYTLSSGNWLMMAAGDDISLPDRVTRCKNIINQYPAALAIGAVREIINAENQTIGVDQWHNVVHGASAAWHRSLFEKFLPINTKIMSEDLILYFRVFLLNGIAVQLFRPLIRYRVDGNTVSNSAFCDLKGKKKNALKKARYFVDILNLRTQDMAYLKQKQEVHDDKKLEAYLTNLIEKNQRYLMDLELTCSVLDGTWSDKMRYMLNTQHSGIHRNFRYRWQLFFLSFDVISDFCGKLFLFQPTSFSATQHGLFNDGVKVIGVSDLYCGYDLE